MADIPEMVRPDPVRRARFERLAEEVYEPLQRFLRRRAAPSDAEDALSDVMLTLWRRLDDVPIDNALPWSYGIARGTLLNQRRAQRRHLRLVDRVGAQPITDLPDPSDSGPDAELAAALSSLSIDDREVLRLWAWEQLEPREIAPVLGVTINAATLRLSRARSRLAEELRRQNHELSGHEPIEGTQEAR